MNRLLEKQLEKLRHDDGSVDMERLLTQVSSVYDEVEKLRNGAQATVADLVDQIEVLHNGHLKLQDDEQCLMTRARSFLQSILDGIQDGIALYDAAGAIQFTNERAAELAGVPKTDQPGKTPCERLESSPLAQHADFKALIAEGGGSIAEHFYEAETSQGRILAIRRAPASRGGFFVSIRDVTHSRRQQRAMKKAEAEYRGLFDNAIIGIYRTSANGKPLRANKALVDLYGYSSEEELLSKLTDIGRQWYVEPGRREQFCKLLMSEGRVTDFVSRVYRPATGDIIWVSETAWPVTDENGQTIYEGMVIDASERMNAQARIENLARYDQLTGLANRTNLIENLESVCAGFDSLPNEAVPARAAALYCLDLCRFKDINDAAGPQVGDKLLTAIGARLKSLCGKDDLVARLGADDFALLRRSILPGENVEAFAHSILQAFEQPIVLPDLTIDIDFSMSAVVLPQHGASAEAALRNADIALNHAKQTAGTQFVLFEKAMEMAVREKRAIEMDLRSALANNEFQLYHQPIVDTEQGTVACHETLLRWRNKERGFVSPAQFIPIAEDSGLIVPIGQWVIEEACRQARLLPQNTPVAVNLSTVQFRVGNIVETIAKALEASGLSPSQFEVEITESVLMENDRETIAILNAIRALGVKIALDDFGTGYSSLGYLQRVTFDKIKIDRTFVSRIHMDKVGAALVRTIVNLGRDLGASVVVEGVETENQLHALQMLGCTLFQGYLFARPQPFSDIVKDGHANTLLANMKKHGGANVMVREEKKQLLRA